MNIGDLNLYSRYATSRLGPAKSETGQARGCGYCTVAAAARRGEQGAARRTWSSEQAADRLSDQDYDQDYRLLLHGDRVGPAETGSLETPTQTLGINSEASSRCSPDSKGKIGPLEVAGSEDRGERSGEPIVDSARQTRRRAARGCGC